MRDAAAFGAVTDGIYERHGRIDGVLHGAGVIEDRLIAVSQPVATADGPAVAYILRAGPTSGSIQGDRRAS